MALLFGFTFPPQHTRYGFYPAVDSQYGDFGFNLATVCMFNTQHINSTLTTLHGNTNTATHSRIINTQAREFIVKRRNGGRRLGYEQTNHQTRGVFLKGDILVQTEGTET